MIRRAKPLAIAVTLLAAVVLGVAAFAGREDISEAWYRWRLERAHGDEKWTIAIAAESSPGRRVAEKWYAEMLRKGEPREQARAGARLRITDPDGAAHLAFEVLRSDGSYTLTDNLGSWPKRTLKPSNSRIVGALLGISQPHVPMFTQIISVDLQGDSLHHEAVQLMSNVLGVSIAVDPKLGAEAVAVDTQLEEAPAFEVFLALLESRALKYTVEEGDLYVIPDS